ncbi:hypothetical protein A1O1_04081 [Capronia coronata CBS 617.96]|uniref:Ribosomal protein S18 n=1 Tax=Capronia coronata CBS 617.96 TaxID=1182541 RepID=W9Z8Z3_9EURO|nr:uncharacterized protein A1O1_04081 [Capronia coronata CBS 617.96]EXJ90974.1 hypothetical protein A1O1_04081 [Capronia coronata CBS 617.96]
MSIRLAPGLGPQLRQASNLLQPSAVGQTFKRTAATTLMSLKREELLEQENYAIQRQLPRQWKVGDVYAPHDLSGAEARKWRKRHRPTTDAFDALSINPLSLYKAGTSFSLVMIPGC